MRLTTKIIAIVALIIIIIALIWELSPLQDAQNRISQLPLQGPSYQGMDTPLTAPEKEDFKNLKPIKRFYRIGQETAFVYIIDTSDNKNLLSDPLSIFEKEGWKIVEQKEVPIPGGVANLVKLSNGSQNEEVLYWLSNGSKHYISSVKNWWLSTLRHLSFGAAGDAVILIMIQPAETPSLDWSKLPENFPDIFKL